MSERDAPLLASRGFAKLDCGIVDSSLWMLDHDALRVWVCFLAKCDSLGFLRASAPALASLCRVPLQRFEEIIAALEAPDPYSRSEENDGRRLQRVSGGWVVLNYLAYRELSQRKAGSHAERQARYRKRMSERDALTGGTVTSDALQSRVTQKEEGRGKREEVEKLLVAPLALPGVLDTPDFRQAWIDWFAYRQEAKLKAWKPATVKAKLAELVALGPNRATEAIRRSIANGWQGIFPSNEPPKSASSAVKVSKLDDKARAALDRIGRRNLEPEVQAGTRSDSGAPVSIQGRLQKTANALPEYLPSRDAWRERITSLSGDSEEIKANLESIGQEIGVPLLSLFNGEAREAA